MIYSEYHSWNVVFGGEAVRISVANERGEEFYCLLPFSEGREFRALRKKALDVLGEAIESGMQAGEIRWRS